MELIFFISFTVIPRNGAIKVVRKVALNEMQKSLNLRTENEKVYKSQSFIQCAPNRKICSVDKARGETPSELEPVLFITNKTLIKIIAIE